MHYVLVVRGKEDEISAHKNPCPMLGGQMHKLVQYQIVMIKESTRGIEEDNIKSNLVFPYKNANTEIL